jgi:histo-blood group ABO system transferase
METDLTSVGLCITATGRYVAFVPPLLKSAGRFLLAGHDVRPFVFTDALEMPGVTLCRWAHRPWPDGALLRYHAYWGARGALQRCEYILAMDADMLFVGAVGTEVLSDLTATQHPGFLDKRGTYETRPESRAYVGPQEGRRYYCGAFVGGRSDEFLSLARRISRAIDLDRSEGLVAVWHDESHLNRQLIDTPPAKVLSPAYCTPEGCDWFTPTEPARVLALAKNHAEFQA